MLYEGYLTVIAIALAFAWPRLANRSFSRVERGFGRLARRKRLAVTSVVFATLLVRIAIIPLCPIPLPFAPDDFSNLLACNTFLQGRLANPTPAMWTHFETIHVDMKPMYASMYFPAQGLVMAAGKVLFGNPWFGILCTSALMCGAICWMLQAWLPPGWALLGGFIAMVRIGLFSYWVNTYTGAGLIAGLGGALVLGALPRLTRTARFHYGMLMAVGIVLLVFTRPYEGLLLCLPVAFALGRWAMFGKYRRHRAVLLRRAAAPLLLIVVGICWLGYYDYRAFGSPTTLPYTVNRATYAMAPYYVWQSPRPEPVYRHPAMRRMYYESELKVFWKGRSSLGIVEANVSKVLVTVSFFAGFALFPPLLTMRRALRDRRIRFLVVSVLVLVAGMLVEIFLIPHYLAPFTAAFYAIGLQAMRHLRLWSPEGKPVGMALVRLSVVLCFLLGAGRAFASPLGFKVTEWPGNDWSVTWYGPDLYGTERSHIESRLEQLSGMQLVFVRDSPKRDPKDQWVYNDPDIDGSKVVWAWDMDAANNRELMQYYPDRKAWLVNMDTEPATVSPYALPVQSSIIAH
jgi:hypothetical protein